MKEVYVEVMKKDDEEVFNLAYRDPTMEGLLKKIQASAGINPNIIYPKVRYQKILIEPDRCWHCRQAESDTVIFCRECHENRVTSLKNLPMVCDTLKSNLDDAKEINRILGDAFKKIVDEEIDAEAALLLIKKTYIQITVNEMKADSERADTLKEILKPEEVE